MRFETDSKLSLSKLFSLANRCYDRGSMLMKNNKQLC